QRDPAAAQTPEARPHRRAVTAPSLAPRRSRAAGERDRQPDRGGGCGRVAGTRHTRGATENHDRPPEHTCEHPFGERPMLAGERYQGVPRRRDEYVARVTESGRNRDRQKAVATA